jgi:N-acyl-D-aspartate/D-glutamate deacylase
MNKTSSRAARAACLPLTLRRAALTPARASDQTRLDAVIKGGRVMDPETGTDAVLDVGIQGGRVARISAEPLSGARVIDATGLVVAPGFIDLHSHGQDDENYRLKALDGVTTALELEVGVADVAAFLKGREGRALIHFGATVGHPAVRVAALGGSMPGGAIVPPAGPATDNPATTPQLEAIRSRLRAGLAAGALGVGMGLQYTPGATRLEVIEAFRVAAQARVPVYVHVRSFGRIEPGSSIEAVSEVIGAAAVTGAPLHIVHINSSGVRDALECLRLVEGARARGLDVTTEAYPYGAGMTGINSALFTRGWREKLGVEFSDLQMVDTGERLTAESFERFHAAPEQRLVIIHTNPPELVDAVMLHPLTIVASDGLITGGKGHPRGAGTYARVLGRYVRSQGRLSLMDAIRKCALLPAQRLEGAAADARRKGRVQEGADADLVVFDPQQVQDRASYERPAEPSVGFRHVLVAGMPVVADGELVEGMYPGTALVRRSP